MLNPISGSSTTTPSSPSRLSMDNDARTAVGQPEIRSPQYQVNINNGETKKESGVGKFLDKLLEKLPSQIMKALDFLGDLVTKGVSMGAKLFDSVAGAAMKAIPFK